MDGIVWVVTYWDGNFGEEPVVTVFDNPEAAKLCFETFSNRHFGCCMDECNLYYAFVDKEE